MCGRYQAWVDDDELMRIIEREKRGNVMRYFRQNEVFPGAIMPVLYGSYSTVRAHLSVWGYELGDGGMASGGDEVSGNGRDFRHKGKTFLINARSETAASKPLFRDSLMNASSSDRRVAIITSGYFEWDSAHNSDGAGRKVRYHIGNPRQDMEYQPLCCEPLLLCGLETTAEVSDRRGEQNGIEHRHVILTTAAYGTPSNIHHRMPLFLRRDELLPWLYDTDFAMRKLRERVPCDLELRKCDF